MLQIAVCGESRIAHSIAAVCGWRGHTVRVLAKRPRRWQPQIVGRLLDGSVFGAAIAAVSDDPELVLSKADVVFVCVRHAEVAQILKLIAPHISPGILVGAVPGFGGFGLVARACLPRVHTFFGTQRIPFVVSGHVWGSSVDIGGIRRQTFVATMPAKRARPTAELIGQILGVRTVPMSHFLNVELSPSNSIVNPARLYSLFGPHTRRKPKPEEEFFLDWDMNASRALLAVDRELQNARPLIPRDTSFVAPILFQYDANDARTLTDRIRGLRALAHRNIPVRSFGGTLALDPQTDYVREDIDHGMMIVRDILRLAGAPTPAMDKIWEWRLLIPGSRKIVRKNIYPNPVAAFETIEDLASALD